MSPDEVVEQDARRAITREISDSLYEAAYWVRRDPFEAHAMLATVEAAAAKLRELA